MIRIRDLTKIYRSKTEEVVATSDLSMDIESHSFFTLLGPSGCGKTSLLRCIAGLETPDAGEIWIADRLVFSSRAGVNVPPNKRDIGMVFQSYAIWPHMSVFENVAFPLEARKLGRDRKVVLDALALVGLESLADRSASRLSGGQQQRVAFARAVVSQPAVLLLDEPLSNLDADLRQKMCAELRRLQRRVNVTTVYVTHDQSEALSLSDKIAVMDRGICVEQNSPSELYTRPRAAFTAKFIGNSNVFDGLGLARPGPGGGFLVDSDIGELKPAGPVPEGPVKVFIRPDKVGIAAEAAPGKGDANVVVGEVYSCLFGGGTTELEVYVRNSGGGEEARPVLKARLSGMIRLQEGAVVNLRIAPEDIYVLAASDDGAAARSRRDVGRAVATN